MLSKTVLVIMVMLAVGGCCHHGAGLRLACAKPNPDAAVPAPPSGQWFFANSTAAQLG